MINSYLELKKYINLCAIKNLQNFMSNSYSVKFRSITKNQIIYKVRKQNYLFELSIDKHKIHLSFSFKNLIFEEIIYLVPDTGFINLKKEGFVSTYKKILILIRPENILEYDFMFSPNILFKKPCKLWFSILFDGYKIDSSGVREGILEKYLTLDKIKNYINIIDKIKMEY